MGIDFGLPPIPVRGGRLRPAPLAVARFAREPIPFLLKWQGSGPVVPVADRNPALVVVYGSEPIKALLTELELWQRPGRGMGLVEIPPEIPRLVTLSQSLILLNGVEQRRRRRLALPPTHRAEALQHFQGQIAQTAQVFAERLSTTQLRLDQTCDVVELCKSIALRNNLRCLVGMEDPAQGEQFAAAAWVFTKSLLSPTTAASQWAARKFNRGRPIAGTPYAFWVAAGLSVYDAFVELLRERRRNPQRDVLSAFTQAIDEETGQPMSDEELVGEVLGLYGAGYETTAYTLVWILLLLAAHPSVAHQLREELTQRLGGRAANLDDMRQLPVLNAVIWEAQRLLTVVPISIPRVATQDTELGGVVLPRGTLATAALLAAHHDPEVFPAPRRFRPERWDKLEPSRLPYQFFPFGAGPRRCLGAAFAELQLRVTLSVLLQQYAFSLPTSTRVDYKTVQVTTGPRSAVPLRVHAAADAPRVSQGLSGTVLQLLELPS